MPTDQPISLWTCRTLRVRQSVYAGHGCSSPRHIANMLQADAGQFLFNYVLVFALTHSGLGLCSFVATATIGMQHPIQHRKSSHLLTMQGKKLTLAASGMDSRRVMDRETRWGHGNSNQKICARSAGSKMSKLCFWGGNKCPKQSRSIF